MITTTTRMTVISTAAGIYALTISTCASWNQTGITMAGNQNGSSGSDLTSLYYPPSIFVDNNNVLFVADRDNHRVIKFYPNSTTGFIIAGNGTPGNDSTQLNGTKGVAVDNTGAIIVADSNNYRIQKFVAGSAIGYTLFSDTPSNPLGQMRNLFIDINNNIYVTDSDYNQVVKYISVASNATVVAGGGATGLATNQLSGPYGNFVDANNSLYVADSGNHRILKYVTGSLNGTIVAGNGTPGSSPSQLSNPVAIVVDNNGYIYVADSDNNQIIKWTTNYSAGGICIIGCTTIVGAAANQLRTPRDI